MISILVIGNGNVAFHLVKQFKSIDEIDCTQISSRNIGFLPSADVAIVAVSDDAIAEVSSQIDTNLVVHTSGGSHINSLKNLKNKGVFYPLQSFSKSKEVDFSEIPICLEAESDSDYDLLEKVANLISNKVYRIDSKQREIIHVSAVFANNFSNHMFTIADEICESYGITFEILHPLINETVKKLSDLSPKEAQTGPAIRNDQKTIKKHLLLLPEKYQLMYKLLTESIQNGH
ncbi:MAG: Rossmann-like and DUF2520 domain-containing protein [Polaribacter sp.]|jgi:predicted short-subunit dehydrogenase-like oxidoreductase (DUF2520 family)